MELLGVQNVFGYQPYNGVIGGSKCFWISTLKWSYWGFKMFLDINPIMELLGVQNVFGYQPYNGVIGGSKCYWISTL